MSTPAPALALGQFGVAVGETTLLDQIDLEIGQRSACFLVGPTAAGKSSLLRALAGLGSRVPGFRTWGTARCLGEQMPGTTGPALVHQSARLLISTLRENFVVGLPDRSSLSRSQQEDAVAEVARELGLTHLLPCLDASIDGLRLWEQRAIAIARATLTRAPLVLVDEPTASLPKDDAEALRGVLERVLGRAALLCVTHNRIDALHVGGDVALLAAGRIRECASVEQFFHAPTSPYAMSYVATGSCDSHTLATSPLAATQLDEERFRVGPRGFRWVIERRVGAMPRPGLLGDLTAELASLAALGISRLVCLEEQVPTPRELLHRHGIEVLHFPIVDMQAPELAPSQAFLAELRRAVQDGCRVVVHCKGGLGRTGTMLAAYLIDSGLSTVEALAEVQNIEPRFVQSQVQRDFLVRYANARPAS